jgi:putative ATPase
MDMFDQISDESTAATRPLAERMRPRGLDDFIGQAEIVGPGRFCARRSAMTGSFR